MEILYTLTSPSGGRLLSPRLGNAEHSIGEKVDSRNEADHLVRFP